MHRSYKIQAYQQIIVNHKKNCLTKLISSIFVEKRKLFDSDSWKITIFPVYRRNLLDVLCITMCFTFWTPCTLFLKILFVPTRMVYGNIVNSGVKKSSKISKLLDIYIDILALCKL